MKLLIYIVSLLILGFANAVIHKVSVMDSGRIMIQPIMVICKHPAKFVYQVSFTNSSSPVKIPYSTKETCNCTTSTLKSNPYQSASTHYAWSTITSGLSVNNVARTGRVVMQLYDNQTVVTTSKNNKTTNESIKFLGGATFLIDKLMASHNGTVSHFELHDEKQHNVGQLVAKVTFFSGGKA